MATPANGPHQTHIEAKLRLNVDQNTLTIELLTQDLPPITICLTKDQALDIAAWINASIRAEPPHQPASRVNWRNLDPRYASPERNLIFRYLEPEHE